MESELGGRWEETCCWTSGLPLRGRRTSGVTTSVRPTWSSGGAVCRTGVCVCWGGEGGGGGGGEMNT